MLKHPLPGAARVAAGVAFVFLLSASTGYVAWASQPATLEKTDLVKTDADSSDVRENPDDRRQTPPKYPKDAIDRRVSGTVILLVDVGADGLPLKTELSVERSTPGVDASLVASAKEAVMQWRFEPARDENGKAKPGRVLVPITFDVNDDPTLTSFPDRLPKPAPREVGAEEAPGPVPTYRAVKPPRYPIAAIKERRSGQVLLRALVGSDGMLQQVEVETSSGSPDLDEAAIAAVRGWEFNAAHDGYKAIPAWIGIPVNFSLDEGETLDKGGASDKGDASEQGDRLKHATAAQIDYNKRTGAMVMSGGVDLETSDGRRIQGERAAYDVNTGRLVVDDDFTAPLLLSGQQGLDRIYARSE